MWRQDDTYSSAVTSGNGSLDLADDNFPAQETKEILKRTAIVAHTSLRQMMAMLSMVNSLARKHKPSKSKKPTQCVQSNSNENDGSTIFDGNTGFNRENCTNEKFLAINMC